MAPGRWQRVEELFQQALARTPASGARPLAGLRSLREGDRLDHYRVLRMLGEGGMGVVYEAEDERLGRRVALKVLRPDGADPNAWDRLVREARIAASVVHPHICQVYALGTAGSSPYIAMELVEGESLSARLVRGPLPPAEALRAAVTMLEALAVLHGHGIVHRDLKPSNVFLGRHGLKLLDFGLARPLQPATSLTGQPLTAPGTFVGTPQYASPEQLRGADVDGRSDLFSAAAIVFEMLVGRPPFSGATLAALVHAIIYDSTPVLTGPAAVRAADRVLHRALAKSPDERYATAEAFAGELISALGLIEIGQVVDARPILRLAVLPFRMLRPDPATDYLGSSLADALASALTGFESLVVRSTLTTARVAQPPLDLPRIATELSVDVVLTGSLLMSPQQARVTAELVSVPAGDVWWSHVTEAAPQAVLELHDDLARRVVAALPLSERDHGAPPPARAANEKAFDLYLRGMQLRAEAGAWRQAHAFFVQSLQHDPTFASAWAERGRLERILGKFEDPTALTEAESSFRQALALEPDHGAAQHYYAQLEIDLGRVDAALARLLERAWQRRAEPHIFAALVHACRYGGLLEASVLAHRTAARLDPTIPTSVLHTYYMQGDFARALDEAHRSSDPFEARLLGAMGRREEALEAARREETRFATVPLLRAFSTALRAALEGERDEAMAALQRFTDSRFRDGEGLFYVAEILALLDQPDRAFAALNRSVDVGFLCLPAFERDVYLAPLRAHDDWRRLVSRLSASQTVVSREFDRGRGRALLGL